MKTLLRYLLLFLLFVSCGTAPASEPFSFLVVDDIHFARQNDYDWAVMDQFPERVTSRIKRTVEKSTAEFVPFMDKLKSRADTYSPGIFALFCSGDLLHGASGVHGRVQYDNFFRVYESVHMPVPLVTSFGNHEAGQEMEEQFDTRMLPYMSEHLGFPITERRFSFDHGNAHFIILDGMPPERRDHEGSWGWKLGEAQWAWLENDLRANQDDDHIFIFNHGPLFPVGGSSVMYANDEARHREFVNLLLRYNVRIYFTGHAHLNSVVVYEDGPQQLVQIIPNGDANLTRPAPGATVHGYSIENLTGGSAEEVGGFTPRGVNPFSSNIVYYEKTPGLAGYCAVEVQGADVVVKSYHGLDESPLKVWTLKSHADTGPTRFLTEE